MCLQALEDLHRIGYLHRDIKPQNYAIGRDPDFRKVYLLDFGMSRQFLRKDGSQKRPRRDVGFRGTLFYASYHALKGEEQSRRDDVWSWFFTIIQLALGKLPWRDIRINPQWSFEQRRDVFTEKKQKALSSSKNELIEGLPSEFKIIYDNLKLLQYYDTPNYMLYYGAFQSIMMRNGYNDKSPLDWEPEGEYHKQTMMAPMHTMMFGERHSSED
ncbi:unnamed protein product [Soboliphyme baturini]|uniref:Protein kinase domain-containing protein n=1 Tax=Soboliphyme baturini TaxID=241478 RepID=A0A183J9H9_9BILA|nr:unnamed protein product [Soboliphyme baturini]